jgi:HAD superfamily hydrolase (TIGR01459 family)
MAKLLMGGMSADRNENDPPRHTGGDRIRSYAGMAAIADSYDGFVLDLWGVLHDGERVYDGVIDTLARLKSCNKALVAVSNAPHREHVLFERMAHIGIPRHLYDGAITAGDLVHEELKSGRDPLFARLGHRYLLIGLETHTAIVEGLGYIRAGAPAEADFVLNTGPREVDQTVDDYRALLESCAKLGLPMVCANPDRAVIRDGRLVICGGALAEHYEAMGGAVILRGKPGTAIYDAALARSGIAPRHRIAVVGDSMETDIRGAANAGLDSVLVTGGLHRRELDAQAGNIADVKSVARLAGRHGVWPTMTVPAFIW